MPWVAMTSCTTACTITWPIKFKSSGVGVGGSAATAAGSVSMFSTPLRVDGVLPLQKSEEQYCVRAACQTRAGGGGSGGRALT